METVHAVPFSEILWNYWNVIGKQARDTWPNNTNMPAQEYPYT
jgi:hypothetical protein